MAGGLQGWWTKGHLSMRAMPILYFHGAEMLQFFLAATTRDDGQLSQATVVDTIGHEVSETVNRSMRAMPFLELHDVKEVTQDVDDVQRRSIAQVSSLGYHSSTAFLKIEDRSMRAKTV